MAGKLPNFYNECSGCSNELFDSVANFDIFKHSAEFRNFPATQILREINFDAFKTSKAVILGTFLNICNAVFETKNLPRFAFT